MYEYCYPYLNYMDRVLQPQIYYQQYMPPSPVQQSTTTPSGITQPNPWTTSLIESYVGQTVKTHILGYGNVAAYVLGIDPGIGMVNLIIFLPPYGQQQYAQVHFSNMVDTSPYFEQYSTQRDLIKTYCTDGKWDGAKEIKSHPAWKKPSKDCSWVWSTDEESSSALVSSTFTIENLGKVKTAKLLFARDNYGSVTINGYSVFKDENPNQDTGNFSEGKLVDIPLRYLRQGNNTITIEGYNFPPGTPRQATPRSPGNPAGIYAEITIETR